MYKNVEKGVFRLVNQRKIGIILSYVYTATHVVVNLIYVPLLLGTIRQSEYGLYQLVGSLIAYISIMESLLSAGGVRYYCKYKNENNQEAKEVLIERNMRLVAHIAKKYNNANEDQDDLISIGTIGLIKAIETFKVDKGTRLATYASKCIENEILMNIRINKKNKVQVSLQDPIGVDREGNSISLIDILGTEADYVIDQVELKVQISKLYEKLDKILTQREREIIQLRYSLTPLGYKTQREISQKLNISRSYVSRIEKKALKKLRKELKSEKSLE